MRIKIPISLLQNCLGLTPNEVFTALCVVLGKESIGGARSLAFSLHGGENPFRDGIERLQKTGLVDDNGSLGHFWMRLISEKHSVRDKKEWGVPSPYFSLQSSVVDTMRTSQITKTAFMLRLAIAAKFDHPKAAMEICGVTRSRMYAAYESLKKNDLLPSQKVVTRQDKPFTVQGNAESERIAELVDQLTEGITFEQALADGKLAVNSGMHAGAAPADHVRGCYIGFLRFKSPELSDILDKDPEAERHIVRVPSAYSQGFISGWNQEVTKRGYEKVAELKPPR